MKTKVTVKIDNADREVEIDLTPQQLQGLGLLTQDEVKSAYMPKDAFEAELDRRVKSLTKGKFGLEDLDADPDLKKKVLDKLGVKVTKDGKAELTADQVAELETSWLDRHVKPLKEQLDKSTGRVSKLLDRSLERDIISAGAEAGVKKSLLSPVAKDRPAPIVTMLRDVFGHAEEHDAFFVKKGDGYEFSMDPKGTGNPYQGVREFVINWSKDKNNADFVDAKRPGGAQLGVPGGGQSGVVSISAPSDGKVMTLQDYQSAREQAGPEGRVVVNSGSGV